MTTAYKELRSLFNGLQPSVRRFNNAIKDHSAEDKEGWYNKACFVAMNNWEILPVWYRTFLTNLVKHNWQRFVDYIRRTSILGHLPYVVRDKRLVRKVFGLLARLPREEKDPHSLNHIAFVLCLGFEPKRKISYLAQFVSKGLMTPEELTELQELAVIDC